MATLANALKEEIGRLARKEVRQQTAGTAKSAARCERDIAELKRQVQDLQHTLSALRTQDAPRQTASKKTASKKTAGKKTATKRQTGKAADAESTSAKQSARARFSAKGLKTSRERLGLSADNYGRLIGVSGLSIYNWEQEKARPRDRSIAALATIKGIGKREAAKRLEALAETKASEQPAAKESPVASEDQAKDES